MKHLLLVLFLFPTPAAFAGDIQVSPLKTTGQSSGDSAVHLIQLLRFFGAKPKLENGFENFRLHDGNMEFPNDPPCDPISDNCYSVFAKQDGSGASFSAMGRGEGTKGKELVELLNAFGGGKVKRCEHRNLCDVLIQEISCLFDPKTGTGSCDVILDSIEDL